MFQLRGKLKNLTFFLKEETKKIKMESSDRKKISDNLSRLSQVTNWNQDLENGLVSQNVFNLKMLQKIKVS